jgi:hypothetical protein
MPPPLSTAKAAYNHKLCLTPSLLAAIRKWLHISNLGSARVAVMIRLLEEIAHQWDPTNGPKENQQNDTSNPSKDIGPSTNPCAGSLLTRWT